MVINQPRLREGSLGSTEKACFHCTVFSAGWTPKAGQSALLVTLSEERIAGLPPHVLHKGREHPPPRYGRAGSMGLSLKGERRHQSRGALECLGSKEEHPALKRHPSSLQNHRSKAQDIWEESGRNARNLEAGELCLDFQTREKATSRKLQPCMLTGNLCDQTDECGCQRPAPCQAPPQAPWVSSYTGQDPIFTELAICQRHTGH